MKPSARFVELDKTIHNRTAFDCGEEELNVFLREFAAKHRNLGISKTMVLPSLGDNSIICSWYTLSTATIDRRSLPIKLAKRLPHYPIPAILIAQLAVAKEAQGQQLGKLTLFSAMQDAYELNLQQPSWAVTVDALNDNAQAFYESFGFQVINSPGSRVHLYLRMVDVAQLVNPEQAISLESKNLRETSPEYIVKLAA